MAVQESPNIPIVGQAMKAHEGNACVTLTCLCKVDNPPMFIPCVQASATCRRCGATYVIESVQYQMGKQMTPYVTVGRVVAKPAGKPV